MSQWCQFCDKEMHFKESVVHVQDYVTCGSGKCRKKAEQAALNLWNEDQAEKAAKAELERKTSAQTPALVAVFRTQTPAIDTSWEIVPPENHPEFLKDPEVLGRMLSEGIQAQDSDDPDWWYHVMETDTVVESVQRANPH